MPHVAQMSLSQRLLEPLLVSLAALTKEIFSIFDKLAENHGVPRREGVVH